jgi:TM2 domain-containing membrane protein YozV
MTAIVLSSVIIVIILCLIMYISWHYYNEEGLTGYQLTNSNDVRRDEIKYTNLSFGPV